MFSEKFKNHCLDYGILNFIAENFIINDEFPISCLSDNFEMLSFGEDYEFRKYNLYLKYLICSISLLQINKSFFDAKLRNNIKKRCDLLLKNMSCSIEFDVFTNLNTILLYLKSRKDQEFVRVEHEYLDFTISILETISSKEKEEQLNYEDDVNLAIYFLECSGLILENNDILIGKRQKLLVCLMNLHSSLQTKLLSCFNIIIQTKLKQKEPKNELLLDFKFLNPIEFQPEVQFHVRRLISLVNENFVQEYYNIIRDNKYSNKKLLTGKYTCNIIKNFFVKI